MKMTVEQLVEICMKNKHCVDCPMFHYKYLCDHVKEYIDLGELELDVTGTKMDKGD